MSKRAWKQHERTSTLVLLCALAGCSQSEAPVRPRASADSSLASLVTSAVALSLGSDGKLALPPPLSREGEIGEEAARTLARIWVRDFAPMRISSLERDRGARIDLAHLHPCGRSYYVDTPLEPVSQPDVPRPIKKALGAAWLISLCGEKEEAQVSLAIAALTDVTVVNDSLKFPNLYGNDFFSVAIPATQAELPRPPEVVIRSVVAATGRRVSSLPRLVRLGALTAAQSAQWQVEVESEATVQLAATGKAVLSHEFFASGGRQRLPELSIAKAEQPDTLLVDYPIPPDFRTPKKLTVRRRAGYFLAFDEVKPNH